MPAWPQSLFALAALEKAFDHSYREWLSYQPIGVQLLMSLGPRIWGIADRVIKEWIRHGVRTNFCR
jgi:hypothetical protein